MVEMKESHGEHFRRVYDTLLASILFSGQPIVPETSCNGLRKE